MKMRHESAGVENARHGKCGTKIQRRKMRQSLYEKP